MDPETEKLLREFLGEEFDESRANWRDRMQQRMDKLFSQSMTVRNELFHQITSVRNEVSQGFFELRNDLNLVRRDQDEIKRRLEVLEEADEVTGVQDRAHLIEKIKSERGKVERWQSWFLGIVAVLLVALVSAGATLAIKALREPVKTPTLPASVRPAPSPKGG